MELTYAPISSDDIETIYACCKQLIDEYEDLDSIDYEKVLSWVRRKIQNQRDQYVQVLLEGTQVGFYHLIYANDMVELDDLYILPPFQNRGIGTQVIKKCCQETALPVMLYVFTRNRKARALYERLGFQITQSVGTSRLIMMRNSGVVV